LERYGEIIECSNNRIIESKEAAASCSEGRREGLQGQEGHERRAAEEERRSNHNSTIRLFDNSIIDPAAKPGPDALAALNKLCVRLVFCVYAEDAGVFAKDQFLDFMRKFHFSSFHLQLAELFRTLRLKPEERGPFLSDELRAFPYVGGALFREDVPIAPFTEKAAKILLGDASERFDWSEISPTIFGAVFESTLNPETRRKDGMHYTSEENIHKVIDPLFLDALRAELAEIRKEPNLRKREAALVAFQERLGSLRFLDPACGSGNFLTETYISLRKIENEALALRFKGQGRLDLGDDRLVHVSISQFHGIEVNDFAVTVAQTAMWIAECKMMQETNAILAKNFTPLPLTDSARIFEGNALRIEWGKTIIEYSNNRIIESGEGGHAGRETLPDGESVGRGVPDAPQGQSHTEARSHGEVSTDPTDLHGLGMSGGRGVLDASPHFDYIMGNPPFVGGKLMSASQKEDMLLIFGKKWKNLGNMDYVSCWYKKAAELMRGTNTRAALVSTNSIVQGQAVASLLGPLMSDGLVIDYAWRTFRWDSEAAEKAHVHCVIVGFHVGEIIEYSNNRIIESKEAEASCRAGAGKGFNSEADKWLRLPPPLASRTAATNKRLYETGYGAEPHDKNLSGQLKTGESGEAGGGGSRSSLTPIGVNKNGLKTIYAPDGTATAAANINAYLMDGPDIVIDNRTRPICDVPPMDFGNMPNDGGNLLLTPEERDEVLAAEPALVSVIRPFVGATEFINGKTRYCFWLKGADPGFLRASPTLRRRVEAVRAFRLASTASATREKADAPHLFFYVSHPDAPYLLVPSTSSERRRYVPIGYEGADTIASNAVLIVPGATLCHFGVLTSSVHMAWLRAVGGRLEMRYRYSNKVVYNNFPWPTEEIIELSNNRIIESSEGGHAGRVTLPDGESAGVVGSRVPRDRDEPRRREGLQGQEGREGLSAAEERRSNHNSTIRLFDYSIISQTAQAILDVRAKYPTAKFADLYDDTFMPADLRAAHAANDRAVLAAYGLPADTPEPEIVAHLFRLYAERVEKLKSGEVEKRGKEGE